MDYRDLLEVMGGFILGICAVVVAVFSFVFLVDFKGLSVKIEQVNSSPVEPLVDASEASEEPVVPVESNADRLVDKIRKDMQTSRYEIVEVCINGVLHYKTQNGGLTQRWNLNGTLISCDFGEYNKKTMSEPDADIY